MKALIVLLIGFSFSSYAGIKKIIGLLEILKNSYGYERKYEKEGDWHVIKITITGMPKKEE